MSTTNSTLEIKPLDTYCGSPNTERGRPTVLGCDLQGKRIVYGCSSRVIIREIDNPLKCILYNDHTCNVTSAKFSPNGYWVASGDENGHVRIWATNNDDLTTKLEVRPITGPVRDIDWTLDSQRVVIVGEGKSSFAAVFIYDTGSPVGEVSGHTGRLLSCVFRPQRPMKLVTSGEDFLVNFYTGPPFKYDSSHQKHTNYVNSVRYAPDGSVFASVSSDKQIILYEGKTGDEIGEMDKDNGHKGSIYSCSFTKDSKYLLTSSADKTTKLWDVSSKSHVSTFKFDNETEYMQVGCLAVGDNLLSLSLNGDITLLNKDDPSKPKKVISGHNSAINSLVYDSNTNIFYSAGSAGHIVSWEVGKGSVARIGGKFNRAVIVGIDIDGDQLIVAYQDNKIAYIPKDTLKCEKDKIIKIEGTPKDVHVATDTGLAVIALFQGILLVQDGKVLELHKLPFEPNSASISPSGDEIAVGGSDKKLHIYSVSSSSIKEVAVLEGHLGKINKVRYSPNGKMIASGDTNSEVIVWDSIARTTKQTGLTFHTSAVRDLNWSSDSKLLVSGSADRSVIVWQLGTKERAISIGDPRGVNAVSFIGSDLVVSAGVSFTLQSFKFKTKE